MQASWTQILIGGILGVGLWSGIGSLAAQSAPYSPTPSPSEATVEADATPSAEMVASPRPEVSQTPEAPVPSPTPHAEVQPELPILRGTMVGTTTSAVLEYQGMTRVLKEGDAIGPFRVGGIYPKKASVAGEGHKYFLALTPQQPATAAAAGTAPRRESGTAQWVNGLTVTQVVREGSPIGLLIHNQGAPLPINSQEGPLSQYGVYDSDVVKTVNGRPLRAQEDLWWLHEELLHSPSLEIAMERGGVDQTLRQTR